MTIDFNPIEVKQFEKDFAGTALQLQIDSNRWFSFWADTLDPRRATEGSMCYDLFAPFDFSLKPGEEIKIPTGCCLYVEGDQQVGLLVLPRSGAGFKYYTRLANTVGVIDSDYYSTPNGGHIWVKVRNESVDGLWTVTQGQAFAQGILVPYLVTSRDKDQEKKVRVGGFGSTDQ